MNTLEIIRPVPTPSDLRSHPDAILAREKIQGLTNGQELELEGFYETWRDKPKDQVVSEFSSWISETNRKPDLYGFLLNEKGDLISSETGQKIRDVIGKQRFTYALGDAEFKALCNLEKLASEKPENPIIWISEPHPGIYPDTKLIISEVIQKGSTRMLFNWAIILDKYTKKNCQTLYRKLGGNNEEIRSTPLSLDTKGEHWSYFLDRLIDDPQMHEALALIKDGKDVEIKEKNLETAESIYSKLYNEKNKPVDRRAFVTAIGKSGAIGASGSSCPTSSGTIVEGVIGSSAALNGECKKIKCGKPGCGWEAKEEDVTKIKNGTLKCCPDCGWKP